MSIKKYRTKPSEVEVLQYDGRISCNGVAELCSFVGGDIDKSLVSGYVLIPSPIGNLVASNGDYIVKSADGTFKVYKPDAFEKEYEEVKSR